MMNDYERGRADERAEWVRVVGEMRRAQVYCEEVRLTRSTIAEAEAAEAAVDAQLASAPKEAQPSDAERYRAVLEDIAAMTYDQWSNGAIAGDLARGVLAARTAKPAAGESGS